MDEFLREIRGIEADGEGSLVTLECGHTIWSPLPPGSLFQFAHGNRTYCAICLHNYIDKHKESKP